MTVDIKHLRELLSRATPGPWGVYDEMWGCDICPERGLPKPTEVIVKTVSPDHLWDAHLVTALRNNAEELLAELERTKRALVRVISAAANEDEHPDAYSRELWRYANSILAGGDE